MSNESFMYDPYCANCIWYNSNKFFCELKECMSDHYERCPFGAFEPKEKKKKGGKKNLGSFLMD